VSTGGRLRAFLIDDEPLALKRLGRMLEATGRVEIVGRATDPEQGLRQVGAQPVDVLFLDIHMPGLSGFEVVERVPPGPAVVFTTAHDQHAVRAFEVNAIDYLLKPVERARLDRALDRVGARRDDAGGDLRSALERLVRDLRGAGHLEHLASRLRDRVHLVPVEQVTHVVARDRATYAVTAAPAEHVLDMTIAELERRLDPARFFRIHRAVLVNVAWVGELRADEDGHLQVCLKDPRRSELPVARDRVRALKERLGVV
jgi:two-component system, LytTR family, response regulator